MDVIINKSIPQGAITVPPSKSHLHRLLIIAAFNTGTTVIQKFFLCDDIKATVNCLIGLGVNVCINKDIIILKGIKPSEIKENVILDCKESASTFRMLLPVVLLSGKKVIFTGSYRLFQRIYSDVNKFLISLHCDFVFSDNRLQISGHLKSGHYKIDCSATSQLFSGLCIALSLLDDKSIIEPENIIVSKPYIELTVAQLKSFGAECCFNDAAVIETPIINCDREFTVEGDWSCASNFVLLKKFGDIEINGLAYDSLQADTVSVSLIDKILIGFCDVDLKNCPDLAPVLFVAAALSKGARFYNTERLKYKESDRLNSMIKELHKCGVTTETVGNYIDINPVDFHSPESAFYTYNDHRIAMALSILASQTGATVKNVDCVSKSAPDFFVQLKMLNIDFRFL